MLDQIDQISPSYDSSVQIKICEHPRNLTFLVKLASSSRSHSPYVVKDLENRDSGVCVSFAYFRRLSCLLPAMPEFRDSITAPWQPRDFWKKYSATRNIDGHACLYLESSLVGMDMLLLKQSM